MPVTEERKEYFKKYYLDHKSYYAKYSAAWWKAHPEKLREKWRRRYWNNRDKQLTKKKALRKRNVEHYRAVNREWQKRRWVHRQAYMRDYYAKHAEEIKSRGRLRHRIKPEISIAAGAKRRALKSAATVNLKSIKAWVKRIKSKHTAVCYWCSSVIPVANVHFDHIIPLSKGGLHSISNLCVACAHCNLTKQAQSVRAWVRIGQQNLEL